MNQALATFLRHLPDLALGASGAQGDNRLALEGVTITAVTDGTLAIGIRGCEATSLRMSAGPLVLDVGRLALRRVEARVRTGDAPGPQSLQAEAIELEAVKLEGPLDLLPAADGAWSLEPLAAANGRITARILDAHLLFDADVAVPLREGQVDFDAATVEHVGPDSRMGVSRMGLYVDAPNGRSYLYQFAGAPVAGVEFERRGALLGARVTHRGRLSLREFAEGLLRQGAAGAGQGFTAQARLLLDRTALSGEVRLGDGKLAAPGVQGELTGRAEGSNTVRLHADQVGRGVAADIDALSLRGVALQTQGPRLQCDSVTGKARLRLSGEGGQLRFSLQFDALRLDGVRITAGT